VGKNYPGLVKLLFCVVGFSALNVRDPSDLKRVSRMRFGGIFYLFSKSDPNDEFSLSSL
jgi:hypothetical protein